VDLLGSLFSSPFVQVSSVGNFWDTTPLHLKQSKRVLVTGVIPGSICRPVALELLVRRI